jgi:hypothetical protein
MNRATGLKRRLSERQDEAQILAALCVAAAAIGAHRGRRIGPGAGERRRDI